MHSIDLTRQKSGYKSLALGVQPDSVLQNKCIYLLTYLLRWVNVPTSGLGKNFAHSQCVQSTNYRRKLCSTVSKMHQNVAFLWKKSQFLRKGCALHRPNPFGHLGHVARNVVLATRLPRTIYEHCNLLNF